MAPPPSDIEHAVSAIRTYLQLHPRGADTPEGVAQWWLGSSFSLAIIAAALEQLLASGEVERTNIGQRQLWRRSRQEN